MTEGGGRGVAMAAERDGGDRIGTDSMASEDERH